MNLDNGEIVGFKWLWDKNYHTLELRLDDEGLYDPYVSRDHYCDLNVLLGKECMIELRDFLDQKIKECP